MPRIRFPRQFILHTINVVEESGTLSVVNISHQIQAGQIVEVDTVEEIDNGLVNIYFSDTGTIRGRAMNVDKDYMEHFSVGVQYQPAPPCCGGKK